MNTERQENSTGPFSHGNPVRHGANTGRGAAMTVRRSFEGKEWTEDFEFVEGLRKVAEEFGVVGTIVEADDENWLKLPGELYLCPQMAEIHPQSDGSIHTVTTIGVWHEHKVPQGTFEFQHSVHNDMAEAITSGFRNWWQLDYPVFHDLVTGEPSACTHMEYTSPDKRITGRRIVFGPPHQLSAEQPTQEEDHAFCPCCLFTRSIEAFQGLLDADGYFGLRLYAARFDDGEIGADCRINGEDFEPGKEALIKYASRWPGRGFEQRKQYVAIEPKPN